MRFWLSRAQPAREQWGDMVPATEAPSRCEKIMWHSALLILSDFGVHSFRPPMEEAMSRLWSQLG